MNCYIGYFSTSRCKRILCIGSVGFYTLLVSTASNISAKWTDSVVEVHQNLQIWMLNFDKKFCRQCPTDILLRVCLIPGPMDNFPTVSTESVQCQWLTHHTDCSRWCVESQHHIHLQAHSTAPPEWWLPITQNTISLHHCNIITSIYRSRVRGLAGHHRAVALG